MVNVNVTVNFFKLDFVESLFLIRHYKINTLILVK